MRKAGRFVAWAEMSTYPNCEPFVCDASSMTPVLYRTRSAALAGKLLDTRITRVEIRELPKPKRKRAPKREGER